MLEAVTRNWWLLLIRGLCAIGFGIAAFAWPGITLLMLALLYGAHALVDGITAIILGVGSRKENQGWWAMLLVGLAGIGAGIVSFVWPQITVTVLLVLVATWSIVRGIFEIVAAIRLRKEIENEWLLGLAGLASVLFGIALLAWPAAGLITIVWFIAANAIAFGILSIALSLRLRRMHERLKQHHHPAPPGAMPA